MSVTIQPRRTWAVYVNGEHRELAFGDPVPFAKPWRPWTGGVFIHYRGWGSFSPDSEEDCKRDVARQLQRVQTG